MGNRRARGWIAAVVVVNRGGGSATASSRRDREGCERENAGDPRERCRRVAAKRNRSNRLLLRERERERARERRRARGLRGGGGRGCIGASVDRCARARARRVSSARTTCGSLSRFAAARVLRSFFFRECSRREEEPADGVTEISELGFSRGTEGGCRR